MNPRPSSAPADRATERLIQAVEGLRVHNHLCLIYQTPTEQFAAVLPFMRSGLQRGERCIYIADENTTEAVLEAMRAAAIDVYTHLRSGALAVVGKRESYLKQGRFDPDWMIGFLKEQVQAAKAAGFQALRATGEMTWVLGAEPGVDRLLEYEAKLNQFYPEHDVLGICQYNRTRFAPQVIKGIIETHPLVISGGLVGENRFYIPPEEYLKAPDVSLQVDRMLDHIQERARTEQDLRANQQRMASANQQLGEEVARRQQLEAELEARVAARTAALETANEGLRQSGLAALNLMEDAVAARARAETALEVLNESNQLLRDTGEMAKVGGWELDLSTKEVLWTEEVGRIHGVEPGYHPKLEEALNFYAPESRPKVEAVVKKAAETGEPYDLESLFIPRGSKDQIWVRSLGRAVYSGGRIVKLAGTFQNIDKHKRAEEALRHSQVLYRSLVEHLPQSVFRKDRAGRFLFANERFCQGLGRSLEDIVGKTDADFFPPELAQAYRQDDLRTMETGQVLDQAEKHLGADGRELFVQIVKTPLRDTQGQIMGVQGIFWDITKRMRAEEEVRFLQRQMEFILGATKTGLDVIDSEFNIRYIDPEWKKVYGDHSGRKCYEYFMGRNEVCRGCGITKALETKSIVISEEKLPRENNRSIQITTIPFQDQTGKWLCAEANVDIAERKRAEEGLRASEEKLRALAARLQAAREEERISLAREIHDVLAQELARLKIDLVWLHGRLTKPGKAAAPEAMGARVSAMSQMADEAIQSVQRIATGLRPAVLDSLGLCAAVEWQARDFRAHTRIPCHATVPEEEQPVDRDLATAMFRILQESLTNVQRHAQATRVDILLREEAGQLVLRVQDNGCGIGSETLSSPLSIGLTGMRERALLMGGQFEIRSQPGSGTTIEVRLPLSKNENLPAAES